MTRIVRNAVVTLLLAALAAWAFSWAIARPQPQIDGTLQLPGLGDPVTIIRDHRGVPHIHAHSDYDAFFAQGYVVAQDRLFQLDLLRRLVAGELAEVFGSPAVASDSRHRRLRPRQLARRIYAHMTPAERSAIDAYTAGINAAMAHEPLPVEFRLLFYTPKRWLPEDSVLAGLETVLELTNDWDAILAREQINHVIGRSGTDALEPISDPAYDVPLVDGAPAPVACDPPVRAQPPNFGLRAAPPYIVAHAPPEASNEWAVGGEHTIDGHALVANDPHLDYSEPGPWYLVELQTPDMHVTGAALPGTPGVILGHTEGLAWGVTSATVSTVTVYRDPLDAVRTVGRENIGVRFGAPVAFADQITRHGFVVDEEDGFAYSAQWTTDRDGRIPLASLLALDHASTIEEGLQALSTFPGPVLNFVLGDRSGRVAYHMVGHVPDDGVWSRYVVDGAQLADAWHGYIPFDQLPHVAPSRSAILFTANNRVYGDAYPFRLTDHFVPPYRASRIHDVLESSGPLDVASMQRLQLDDLSLPEYEFARGLADYLRQKPDESDDERVIEWSLEGWDGRMTPESHAATLAHQLLGNALVRYAALVLGNDLGPVWRQNVGEPEATASLLCALRSHALSYRDLFPGFIAYEEPEPWGEAGSVTIHHPLHLLGIPFFDAPAFAGSGDFASVKVQTPTHGQSFRAVWDVGSWDRGGIILPLGESGRPGSPYLDDEQEPFAEGQILPLLYVDSGEGRSVLKLEP
ncbi:MAG TPA: penicillin acylase family protein [Candidatus Acidoferrales bacterium]|nr:penicillin acylase family protein [Candidatus Acidoferrales bacterium]